MLLIRVVLSTHVPSFLTTPPTHPHVPSPPYPFPTTQVLHGVPASALNPYTPSKYGSVPPFLGAKIKANGHDLALPTPPVPAPTPSLSAPLLSLRPFPLTAIPHTFVGSPFSLRSPLNQYLLQEAC